MYQFFTNNHASFHLKRKFAQPSKKVSKHYEHDSRYLSFLQKSTFFNILGKPI